MPDGRQRREHLMSEYVAASTATAAAAAAAAAEPSSSSGASDSSAPLRGGDASRSDTREAAAGLGLRAAGKGGGGSEGAGREGRRGRIRKTGWRRKRRRRCRCIGGGYRAGFSPAGLFAGRPAPHAGGGRGGRRLDCRQKQRPRRHAGGSRASGAGRAGGGLLEPQGPPPATPLSLTARWGVLTYDLQVSSLQTRFSSPP